VGEVGSSDAPVQCQLDPRAKGRWKKFLDIGIGLGRDALPLWLRGGVEVPLDEVVRGMGDDRRGGGAVVTGWSGTGIVVCFRGRA
jgi:hypothetical protein